MNSALVGLDGTASTYKFPMVFEHTIGLAVKTNTFLEFNISMATKTYNLFDIDTILSESSKIT